MQMYADRSGFVDSLGEKLAGAGIHAPDEPLKTVSDSSASISFGLTEPRPDEPMIDPTSVHWVTHTSSESLAGAYARDRPNISKTSEFHGGSWSVEQSFVLHAAFLYDFLVFMVG